MGVFEDFNSGKQVDIPEGGSMYTKELLKVTKVKMIKGGSNDHPLVMKMDSNADILEFNFMIKSDKTEVVEYQVLNKSEDGNYMGYKKPRSTSKTNGKTYPATLAWDILESAVAYDPTQDRSGMKLCAEKFVGLKFEMGVKRGKRKNGEDFVMLETDRQKLQDEEYLAGQKKVDEIAGATWDSEPSTKTPEELLQETENEVVTPDDMPF